MTLEQLEPKEVFHYFKEICKIPHGSGNVKQISDYCVDFAKQHGLKYRQDEDLNVIIWKDGSTGSGEFRRWILLCYRPASDTC